MKNLNKKFTIKPEFCDSKEEESIVFIIIEDNGDRMFAQQENSTFSIVPTFLFKIEMINIID